MELFIRQLRIQFFMLMMFGGLKTKISEAGEIQKFLDQLLRKKYVHLYKI